MLALVFGEKELFWEGKLKASDVRVAVKVRTSHIPGPLYRIKIKGWIYDDRREGISKLRGRCGSGWN